MEQEKKKFLSNVDQTDTCWNWEGYIDNLGYGNIKTNFAKQIGTTKAHRISYWLFKGEFDKKMDVLHDCDNRKCVNPDHLHLGTQADNNKERDERGRHKALKGLEHGSSIFTKEQVDEILKLRADGMFYKDIAERFNCNRRTIERLCLKKTGYLN